MSQITDHVLDPYNVPVLLEIDADLIRASIAEDLNKISLNDVFGYGDCKGADWMRVLKRYQILNMFECTNATTLDEEQLKCLVGSVFKGLDKQVPCNKGIYS